MPIKNMHFVPEHGLQIEETFDAKDHAGVFNLFRYWWAWAVARDYDPSLIWDLCCGSGHGPRILAEQSEHTVVGFDVDPLALNEARRQHVAENLAFVTTNLDRVWEDPAFHEGMPSIVTCFEGIEFLSNRELFFEQLLRCFSPETVFLFATPCWEREAIDFEPDWKAQKILYDFQTIRSLLYTYFNVVRHSRDRDFPMKPYLDKINDYVAGAGITVGDNLFYCAHPGDA